MSLDPGHRSKLEFYAPGTAPREAIAEIDRLTAERDEALAQLAARPTPRRVATLQEACEVLSSKKHAGLSFWRPAGAMANADPYRSLNAFEAVAVANALLDDGPQPEKEDPDSPGSSASIKELEELFAALSGESSSHGRSIAFMGNRLNALESMFGRLHEATTPEGEL